VNKDFYANKTFVGAINIDQVAGKFRKSLHLGVNFIQIVIFARAKKCRHAAAYMTEFVCF